MYVGRSKTDQEGHVFHMPGKKMRGHEFVFHMTGEKMRGFSIPEGLA